MNFQGDVCVFIMGVNFEVIGSVNFNFLVIMLFLYFSMEVIFEYIYWKKLVLIMVIGYCGLGKNMMFSCFFQLGENIVFFFIVVVNFGVNYVEFDVQFIKDYVLVIYYDFLVSEIGFDVLVYILILE